MKIVIHTTVSRGRQLVDVSSLEEAGEVWVKHRNAGNGRLEVLDSADIYKGCGDVLNDKGEKVARVAYNGRVFEAGDIYGARCLIEERK